MKKHSLLQSASPWLLLGTFLSLLWLEHRRPLRRRVEPQPERIIDNLMVGAKAGVAVACLEVPLARPLTRIVERNRIGLIPKMGLSPRMSQLVTLTLLDYTLYLWHILLHRVPALWRWHQVHHADRDLDVSTALRFQAVEMLWSIPWRIAQIVLIGVPSGTLALWARVTLAEVMFHHSNLRLPERCDRALGMVVATPRLHGIHHSDVVSHQNSNFSSGLTVWDALHGTYRRDVPQEAITIGLPSAISTDVPSR